MDGGSGHCLCGAVRFSFEGAPNWQAHCHCESCRRATASPFTSFLGVSHSGFRWTGTPPAERESSPGVRRFFCATCGTPMAYQSPTRRQEIDLYAATLDDPSSSAPTRHVHWNERLPWVKLCDGLPVHRTPRRLTGDEDMAPVLNLLHAAFAYMEGVIDPPSSLHRLTVEGVARQARAGEIWVLDDAGAPVACLFLTPEPERLYVGKLAVADVFRGAGLARQLMLLAEERARALGLGRLELQSRVELAANHAAFEAMGFERTGETAHEGYDRPTSFTFTRLLG
ncbi:GNAT family N-acetyltransferase [Defluviimonas salinarum]|uniref:GNAT family N-acetyltransferase n=1 Tax=Defluviimonas salinarum TaxID=2992147 RepID=UPI003D80A5E7